jgi:tetratricopeptide (TPR) repeat protein
MTCGRCGAFGSCGAILIAGWLLVPAAVHAEAQPDGVRLAAEGRCAEALTLLGAAPSSADAARARALCLLQEADYAAAAEALAALEAGEPALVVDLGIARFHAGDREGAEGALRRAEAAGSGRPEVPLYLGLIALDRERRETAVRDLVRARAAGDVFAPAAAYYAGVAQARAGDREAAREALRRVASEWPGTPWAEAASREVAALDAPRAVVGMLRIGFEHDSNAVLRGEGVSLPEEIPSQSDQRFVWRGAAGRGWPVGPAMQLGGAVAFSGSVHGDLGSFDVLYPSLTLWAERRLGERTTLRAIGGYGHAWVDTRPFLSSPTLATELHYDWGARGATRAFAELAFDAYRFDSTDSDPALRRARDRDGLGYRIGAEHRLALPELRSSVLAALAYRGFSADGTEYSFDSPEVELGIESTLPSRFVLGAGLRYAFRAYRHPSTYGPPSGDREEQDWRTELSLRRPVWRQLHLEARWRYQGNRSTSDVFDFTRHVVGLHASWTLSP